MMDQEVKHNLLDMDLNFSEEEIREAQKRAAQFLNSIPPVFIHVNPHGRNMQYPYLLATAYQLYLSFLQRLIRQDVEYSSGEVQVNLVARRIKHIKELLPTLRSEAAELASEIKQGINLSQAFGTIC